MLLPKTMPDYIHLRNMQFYGRHGALPPEQSLGQRFAVDLRIETELTTAGLSDRLEDTINYADLFEVVRATLEGPPRKLLETLAETIAEAILAQWLQVQAVLIEIRKPAVPLPGTLDHAAVVIERRRPPKTALS